MIDGVQHACLFWLGGPAKADECRFHETFAWLLTYRPVKEEMMDVLSKTPHAGTE